MSYELATSTDGIQWTSLVGDESGSYLGLEYLFTKGVVAGQTYRFKARALNKWGWGPYTPEPHVEIIAATVP